MLGYLVIPANLPTNEMRLGKTPTQIFPRTAIAHDGTQSFTAAGLEQKLWNTTTPVRDIFRAAFTAAGLSLL